MLGAYIVSSIGGGRFRRLIVVSIFTFVNRLRGIQISRIIFR